jgi:murein DD-endopeptidase MepM/ murein hydrolase activator NlpD
VRLRPALIASAIVLALLLPATAAGSGGGAVAPADGGAVAEGGASFGTPVPAAKKRAAKKKRGKRAAERRRRAKRRRTLRRRPAAPAPAPPSGDHFFPVAGPYTMDGEGSGFGAPRSGHRHMGHDIAAARGVPVVAPYAGVVDWVRFQRAGAGHYVVLDSDDGYDYVFMHLKRGSIPVVEGQLVAAGEQLGEVGNSGRSFGAHLHFEVWVGGWYEKGGEPIDPLPLLEAWAS